MFLGAGLLGGAGRDMVQRQNTAKQKNVSKEVEHLSQPSIFLGDTKYGRRSKASNIYEYSSDVSILFR